MSSSKPLNRNNGSILDGQSYAQTPKVLIISSYHPSYEWTFECEQSIRKTLGSHVDLTVFHMDTKRIPEQEFFTQAEHAWAKYLEEKPNLVMIGDDNALRLVGPRLGNTKTPVVYYGINNNPRIYFEKMPMNITGLLEKTPILPLLRYVRQIIPKARSALVLFDKSQTSTSYVALIFRHKQSLNMAGIRVDYIISDDFAMWKQNVLTLSPSYDFLVASSFHAVKQEDGRHVNLHDVIKWTSANSPVPVFTNQEYSVYDNGAVGAFVTVGESHGRQAAEMALKILTQGKHPKDIPTEADRDGSLYFNTKQLQRFNLTLPKEIKQMAHFL